MRERPNARLRWADGAGQAEAQALVPLVGSWQGRRPGFAPNMGRIRVARTWDRDVTALVLFMAGFLTS